MDEVSIFWTGGWDSTFRVLQLAEKDIVIRPIYVKDPGRRSAPIEIERMGEILAEIERRKQQGGGFRATFAPLEIVDRDYILREFRDDGVSSAWRRLHERYALGEQYEWFALFCKARSMQAECGLEKSERSKAMRVISEQCELVPMRDDSIGGRMRVEPRDGLTESDGYVVLKDLLLGITGTTKEQAKEEAESRGWLDVMKLTWFCFSPVNGKPCGRCNPCRDAMNEGMAWRMPLESRVRYHLNTVRRALGKVKRALVK